MKNILLLICTLISFQTIAQTSLTGKVTDEGTNEPILFGTVSLFKGGLLVTGTDTDLDGYYNFPNIDPGTYDVEVSYVGYQTVRLTGVAVYGGQTNKANVQLGTRYGVDLDSIIVIEYKVPLVKADNSSCHGLTSEQLKNLPQRNIGSISDSLTHQVNSLKPQFYSVLKIEANIDQFRHQNLSEKLPSRRLNHTVQNMLDLKISKIDYGN